MRQRNRNHCPERSEAIIPINWQVVDKMLRAGCSGVEVAARLGMSADNLYSRCEKEKQTEFSAYAAQKKANGQALLREAQFDAAVEGKDRTLLIWLGKQMLEQREPEPRTIEACRPALLEYLERLRNI
jgi:hypothetical protein